MEEQKNSLSTNYTIFFLLLILNYIRFYVISLNIYHVTLLKYKHPSLGLACDFVMGFSQSIPCHL